MEQAINFFAQNYQFVAPNWISVGKITDAYEFINNQNESFTLLILERDRRPRLTASEQMMLEKTDIVHFLSYSDNHYTEEEKARVEEILLSVAQDFLAYLTKLNATPENYFYYQIDRAAMEYAQITPNYVDLRIAINYLQPFSLFFDQTRYA